LLRSIAVAACCLPGVVSARSQDEKSRVPLPIIFDTDMGGDCDKVGAVFILHSAVERGERKAAPGSNLVFCFQWDVI